MLTSKSKPAKKGWPSLMSKKEKLLERLRGVPKDFTFDELQTLLNIIGFVMSYKGKTSGSRVVFMNKDNVPIDVHKPHPGNELKEYQIKEIIKVLKENGLFD